jgi:hypothetical protein
MVLGAAAAFAARGQQGAPQVPLNPDGELKAAIDQQRSNYDQMKKAGLPFFTEPAPVFRP